MEELLPKILRSVGVLVVIAGCIYVFSVTVVAAPFGGVPWEIPGTVEFKDYDTGSEGVAYHDTDPQNIPGEYRPNEGVDIEVGPDVTGGIHQVGYVHSGEWLKYTVNVLHTGTYSMMVRASASSNTQSFHVEVDGQDITGSIATIRGDWNEYADIVVEDLALIQGIHTLKVVFDNYESSGWWGFNYMHFELVSPQVELPPVVIPTPGAQLFYVAPNGNDANEGTINAPWRTLAKAGTTATAGQTVYVRGGTYYERLVPQHSGTEGAYIIFMAYPGETVILDGDYAKTGVVVPRLEGVISLLRKRYIRISGFGVINSGVGVADGKWNSGIHVRGGDHFVLDHNAINRTWSWGIHTSLFSHHAIITHNELSNMNFGFNDDDTGLGTKSGSHDMEISYNHVHHGRNEGLGPTSSHNMTLHHNLVHDMGKFNCDDTFTECQEGNHRVAIYLDSFDGHLYNIDLYNNISHSNMGEGISIANEGAGLVEDIRVYNNLIYNNQGPAGLGIVNWSSLSAEVNTERNISVINNTIYGNYGYGVLVNNDDVSNLVLRNNIVYGNSAGAIRVEPNIPAGAVIQDHNVTGNPAFVNTGQGDFHLQPNSQAIDAGSSLGAPGFDLDGMLRPVGQGWDAGAYEYGGTIPYSTPTPNQLANTGDLDSDGDVDIIDLFQLAIYFGSNGVIGDLDHNSQVNIFDFNRLISRIHF